MKRRISPCWTRSRPSFHGRSTRRGPAIQATSARGTNRPCGIRFLGHLGRSEIQDRFAHAPVFVHPAKYEPFGLAPLEAAFSGAALVLGDIPSLRELWADSAVYVPPDDADAIGSELLSLIGDERRRRTLAEKAGRRAERYRLERMTSDYLGLYEELVSKEERL